MQQKGRFFTREATVKDAKILEDLWLKPAKKCSKSKNI
jgi:hypothetical protein